MTLLLTAKTVRGSYLCQFPHALEIPGIPARVVNALEQSDTQLWDLLILQQEKPAISPGRDATLSLRVVH